MSLNFPAIDLELTHAQYEALFALLAAFAAAFGFLFRTLTQITQGRKRKRSLAGNHETSFGEDNWWEEFKNHLGDQFYHGNSRTKLIFFWGSSV